ncbi:RagB/SusD family nutrient uptake outer membrane protein [Pedobacter deserti]|uniref:RagB/SusD family nutrient uptake outer membrane protein n=1 Tax=Pedobacter deserti TaxID=2817382 RepID=UPI00210A112A|nr:RagB/SusD family nutrient uptake outer membrane protein [Pedobacter sp. SYSU D00382]
MKLTILKLKYGCVALLSFTISSCKKFVDIGTPNGTVPAVEVFKTDPAATAAIAALYDNTAVRESMLNATVVGGALADELRYNLTDFVADFQTNSVAPNNGYLSGTLWSGPYRNVANSNIAIDGLSKSQTLTPAVKSQLLGEAYFWRALAYLQLKTFFGDVPLSTSPDPLTIALLPRSPVADVTALIISDLKTAKQLLTPTYPSSERARANVYAISALLARVYLYEKDWANAEAEATSVISSGVYSMSSLANTFVKTSTETILQVFNLNGVTLWGTTYVPSSATATPNWLLTNDLADAFEAADARKAAWTAALGNSGNFSVSKYKLRTGAVGSEYYVVLRLAEQHLIRAEARAQQNNLAGVSGAEADLNVVRNRANLGSLLNLNKPDMLRAIEKERRLELFGEWFHRWADLKRTPGFTDPSKSRADEVLSVYKGVNWQSTDVLLPISSDEITKNPALKQNLGYEN